MTAVDTTAPVVRAGNPYVGPRSFLEGEKLYGRDREINELRSTLLARRIVLLCSPSGAGKTSLVQAGLRPELESQGFQVWPTARVIYEVPAGLDRSPQPNRYLLSTLMSLEEGRPSDQRLGLEELVEASCDPLDGLDRYLLDRVVDERNPFLIFDQFEELFTLDPADWDRKREFLEGLGQVLRDRTRWALVSMREDYIAQLDPYLDLIPTRFASRYRLDLLEAADALKAAQGPAIDAGVGFTDPAAERLVGDLRTVLVQHGDGTKPVEGRYVEPVQLQVACHRLWSTLDPDDDEIGVDDVEKVGSVDQALADFYSQAVRSVADDASVSEAAIRTWVEMKLITVDGFRSQTREGPEKNGPAVLRSLEGAYVIRADRRLGSTWYELSHDRLVKPIRDSNKSWLDEHLSTLQRARQEWIRNGRRGLLLSGEVLAEAEAWARDHSGETVTEDHEYLEACREAERRTALERKVSRRNRLLAVVAMIVGALAVAGAIVAFALQRQAKDAETNAEDALRQKELAEASQRALNLQNGYLAEADQATDTEQKLERWWTAQAADSRTDTADLTRKMVTVQHYLAHDPVYVADAFDLDRTGRRLARVTGDGGVEVVDVVTLQRQPLTDLPATAVSLAFSPTDDRLMVVGFGEDGRWISVFDLAGASPPVQLDTAGVGFVENVRLSGSAGIVAGIATDGEATAIVVWNASTGELIEAPPSTFPYLVAVSADGSTLASADVDGQLQVWRRTGNSWTNVALPDVPAVVDTSGPLSLSADGRAVAFVSVGADPGGAAWSVVIVDSSLPPKAVPLDQGRAVLSAAFLPDGTLRTLDDAGAVRAWRRTSAGWQEEASKSLPPNLGGVLSAQGTTAAVQAVQGIAIYDVDSGEQRMGQHAASRGAIRGDRAVAVRSGADAGATAPSPGAIYLRGDEPTWEPVGDSPKVRTVFMDRSGQAVGWLSPPSDSADAADVQLGVHTGGTTWTMPGACGGSAADSLAVGTPTDDESRPTLALSGPGGVCLVRPDGTTSVVLEPSPGEVPRAVALDEDATRLVMGEDVNGVGLVVVYDSGEYVRSAWLGAPVTMVRTGAGRKPLAVAGDEQGNVVVLDADDSENGCVVELPVAIPIVAADVIEHDGAWIVASATAKAVFVHRITTTDDSCSPELQSGFDLQREEGEVLDLSFSPDGTVAVLESDHFLFAFDPAATPADVADSVSAMADRRGWEIPQDVGE